MEKSPNDNGKLINLERLYLFNNKLTGLITLLVSWEKN